MWGEPEPFGGTQEEEDKEECECQSLLLLACRGRPCLFMVVVVLLLVVLVVLVVLLLVLVLAVLDVRDVRGINDQGPPGDGRGGGGGGGGCRLHFLDAGLLSRVGGRWPSSLAASCIVCGLWVSVVVVRRELCLRRRVEPATEGPF